MSKASNASAIIMKQIENPSCTADELAGLVGTSVEIDRLIASHGRTDAKTLRKLSRRRDQAIRENVASNPNTSLKVLINLAKDFPRAFLLNPAFNLKLLEDPGFLESLYRPTLAKLLEQTECPLSTIKWAFTFYSNREKFNPMILSGIIRNPSIPVGIIEDVLRLDTPMEISSEEGLL